MRLTERIAVAGAPAGLTADAAGEHRIDLAWDAPSGPGAATVSGYRIEVSADAGGSWSDLEADTAGTGTAHSHAGLPPGATREYRVSAINPLGTGPPSGSAAATTDSSPVSIVSNAGQTHDGTFSIDGHDYATAFATGSIGVTLSSIQAHLASAPDTPASLSAALWSYQSGRPESRLLTLSTPSAISDDSPVTFTAPANTLLDAHSIYWLVLSYSRSGSEAVPEASQTESNDEDTDFSGWEILDVTRHRPRASTGPWTGSSGVASRQEVLRISVNGAFAGPVPVSARVASDGRAVVIGFDEALHAANAPRSAFSVTAGSESIAAGSLAASGASLALEDLSPAIHNAAVVRVRYGDPSGGDDANAVQDVDGNDGPSFDVGAENRSRAVASVPGAPAGLVASGVGDTGIELAWDAPEDVGTAAISGYRIEVSADGGLAWADLAADTGSTATAYSRTGLAFGATRHYRVSAINAVGTGPPSDPAAATAGQSVLWSATLTVGSESSSRGYRSGSYGQLSPAQFSTGATGHAVEVLAAGGGSLSFRLEGSRITSPRPGRLALQLDSAAFALGQSQARLGNRQFVWNDPGLDWADGDTVAVKLVAAPSAPGAPTALSASASASEPTRIDLAWSAPQDDGGAAVSGYRIEVSADAGGTWAELEAGSGGAATAYSHSGVPPGATRAYRVSASNSLGISEPSAAASTNVSVLWDATLTVGSVGADVPGYFRGRNGQLSPAQFSVGATAHTVKVLQTNADRLQFALLASRFALPGRLTLHLGPAAFDLGASDTNTDNQVFEWLNTDLGWADGDTVAVRLTAIPSAPGAPAGLAAAGGESRIDLAWSAPQDDGYSAITGYRIEVSGDAGGTWAELVADTGSAAAAYSDGGLLAGATRHYRVSAINAEGAGPPSEPASATTSGTAGESVLWSATLTVGKDASYEVFGYRFGIFGSLSPAQFSIGTSNLAVSELVTGDGDLSFSLLASAFSSTGGLALHLDAASFDFDASDFSSGNAQFRWKSGAPDWAVGETVAVKLIRRLAVPGAPAGLAATAMGEHRIDLAWDAPEETGGVAISGYRIEVSADGGGSWADLEADTGSAATAYSHGGLPPGAAREYRVSAINAIGASEPSEPAAAASAPASTVVSNVARAASGTFPLETHASAQSFASGSVGLALSSIQVALGAAPDSPAGLSAGVWSDSGGAPESELLPLATLAELSAGPLVTFTAPPAAWLEAGTTYWLVLSYSRTGAEAAPEVSGTASDGEDTAFSGWSVGDTSLHRPPGSGGPWTGAVQTDPQSLRLVVNGTFAGPVPAAAAVAADGTSILLGFDEALHAAMAPNSAFAVTADGAGIAVGGQSADGAELVLRDLSRIIGAGQSVTVSYADPSGEDDPAAVQDADGNDGPSFSIAAANGSAAMPAVPGAPAGLVANSDRASRIQLAWTAPEEAGSGPVSGYRIEVSADGGTTWSDLEPDTGSAATAHSHGGLAYGDTRSYRVSAINAYGTGPASAPASATAGENVLWAATLTVGSDGSALGYASDLYGALSPAQFSTGLTGHAVESLAASGGELAFGLDSALASPGGLALHLDGAAFALGAASQNDGDRHFTWAGGAPDWAVGGTVAVRLTMSAAAPGAPAGLAATPGWSTRIDLAWKAPEETGSGPVSGYRIEVSADAGASWAELVPDSGSAATAHSHSGLSFGDTRRYRVSAINAFGTGPPSAPDSAAADSALRWAATLTVGVSATGTTFGYSSGSDVIVGLYGQLSPAQFSIGGTGHAVDRLHHRSGLADPLLDFTLSAPGLASASGLALHLDSAAFEFDAVSESPNNRQYWWSHPGLGWAAGDTVAVKLTERLSLPGAPSGLTAAAMGEDRVDLAWAAPADTGSEPVSGYRIEVSADGGAAWSDLVPDSGSAGTAHSQTGLPAGAIRHYRVSAISSVGTGPPSEPAFAVTDISVLWEAALTVGSDGTGLGYFAGSYGALSPAQFSIGSTARGVQRIVHSQGSLVFGLAAGVEPLPGGLVLHLDAAAFDLDETSGNTDDIRFAWDSADPGWAVGDTVAVRLTTRPALPGAPSGLTADAMGEHRIDLAWDAPSGTLASTVSGYRIEVSADAGDSWSDLEAGTAGTGTAHSHAGLPPGATREYRVSAINPHGTGPPSGSASATTDSSPVTIVSNAGQTHGGTFSIDGSAYAAAFATGSIGVTLSSIQAHLASAPDTPASLSAALWSYQSGRPESRLLTLSTPSAISGDSPVTFTAPANASLDAHSIYWLVLSYSRSGSEAVPEASHTESDDEDTDFSGWWILNRTVQRPRASTGPWTSGVLSSREVLRISVNGSFAGPVPESAGVSPDGRSIVIGFDEALHAANAPHSAFSVSPGGRERLAIGSLSASGASLALGGLSPAIHNAAVVTVSYGDPSGDDDANAVQDADGNDGPSFSVLASNGSEVVYAAPGKPRHLEARPRGADDLRIDLAWVAPEETGGVAISGYRIEVSADGGFSWAELVADTGNTATGYSDGGLAFGATRHYRVSAINAVGTGPPSDPASGTAGESVLWAATLTVGKDANFAVFGYRFGIFGSLSPAQFSIGTTNLAVSELVTDDGGLSFTLLDSAFSSTGGLALRLDTASFDFDASDFSSGNAHFRWETGTPDWAVGETVAVKLIRRPAVPGAPAGLAATAMGEHRIDLAWDAPEETGGAAISGYRIEVSADGGGSWADLEADTGSAATAYSHSGLPPGAAREYRVSAINAVGASEPSEPAAATSAPASTVVSNVARAASGTFPLGTHASAQSFASGSVGLALSSIQVALGATPADTAGLSAAVWSDSGGAPESELLPLATLAELSAGPLVTFTAPPAARLEAGTTYWLVLSYSGPGAEAAPEASGTASDGEDTAFSGWSVGDTSLHRPPGSGGPWTGDVQTDPQSLRLVVNGTFAGPVPAAAAVAADGTSILLGFDEALHAAMAPNSAFAVTADGAGIAVGGQSADGAELVLRDLSRIIGAGQSVTVSYADPSGEDDPAAVQDADGNDGPSFSIAAANGSAAMPAVPGAPAGLVANSDRASRIQLAWTAPEEAGSGPVSGYRIEVSADGGATWSDLEPDTGSAATAHSHGGLAYGDTRSYRVSAINAYGTGPASAPASATAGENVLWAATLTVGSDGSALGYASGLYGALSPAQFSTGLTGHAVESLAASGGELAFGLDSALASPGGLALHLDGAAFALGAASQNDGDRHFTWAGGAPDWAVGGTVAVRLTMSAAAPGAPAGLAATPGGSTRIDLAWKAPEETGGGPVSGYRIEVSADAGASWAELVPDSGSAATAHSHSGLSFGDTRRYRVSAINAFGTGPPSAPDSAAADSALRWAATLTVGVSATGTTFGYSSGSDVIVGLYGQLSPAQFSIGGTGHAVDRLHHRSGLADPLLDFTLSAPGLASASGLALHLDSAAFEFDAVSESPNNRQYWWSHPGLGWAAGDAVAVKLTERLSLPGAPAGLTAAAMSEHRVDLAWAAPADTGSEPVSGYRIEVSADGGATWSDLVPDSGSAATAHSHTGLSFGDIRHYRVSAISPVGTGPPSEPAFAVTDIRVLWEATLTVGAGGTGLGYSSGLYGALSPAQFSTGAASHAAQWLAVSAGTLSFGLAGDPLPSPADLVLRLDSHAFDRDEAGTNTDNRQFTWAGAGLGWAEGDTVAVRLTERLGAPRAPAGLTADAVGEHRIDLAWDAPTGPGASSLSGYRIEVSADAGDSWSDLEPGTAGTGTAHSHAGLPPGATREYRVSAINPHGTGSPSGTASATTDSSPVSIVSNAGETHGGTFSIDGNAYAAGFATGSIGVTLSSIQARLASAPDTPASLSAAVWSDQSGRPSRPLLALSTPSAISDDSPVTFTAPANALLEAGTTYWFVLAYSRSGSEAVPEASHTESDDEDTDFSGWEILDGAVHRPRASTGPWASGVASTPEVLRISVNGSFAGPAPVSAGVAANGRSIVIGFDEALHAATAPHSAFSVTAGSDSIAVGSLAASGASLTVGDLSPTIREGDAVRVRYSDPAAGDDPNAVQDVDGNDGPSFHVRATNNSRVVTSVPGAPAGLAAIGVGENRIDLAWNAPKDTGTSAISGYRIEVSADEGSTWADHVADTGSTATDYSHSGLSFGDTRHYRVSAINLVAAGPPSDPASATAGENVVWAATLTVGTSGSSSGYFYSPGRIGQLSPAQFQTGATDHTVDFLRTIGGLLSFGLQDSRITLPRPGRLALRLDSASFALGLSQARLGNRHFNWGNHGLDWADGDIVAVQLIGAPGAPGAPTALSATASASEPTRIDLAWSAPQDDGGTAVSGYRIEVSADAGSTWAELEADSGSAATVYSHSSVPAGATRAYRVSAINSLGTSEPSATASTNVSVLWDATLTVGLPGPSYGYVRDSAGELSPPQFSTGTATHTVEELTNDGDRLGFELAASRLASPGRLTLHLDSAAFDLGASDTNIDNQDFIWLNTDLGWAVDDTVNVRLTAIPSAPGAPAGLAATAMGENRIDLAWAAPQDDGYSAITGYRIEVSGDASGTWAELVADSGSAATAYSDGGLLAGATRHYRVSAINAEGAGPPSEPASATTSGTAGESVLWSATLTVGKDANFAVFGYRFGIYGALSPAQFSIGTSNLAVSELVTGDGDLSFSLLASAFSSTGGLALHLDAASFDFDASDFSSGNAQFRWKSGAPDWAVGETVAVKLIRRLAVPGAPAGLAATAMGEHRIDLAWDAPEETGGVAISGYRIEVSADGGGSWADLEADTGSAATAYSHSGLPPGAAREYRVSAINAIGASEPSEPAAAASAPASTVVSNVARAASGILPLETHASAQSFASGSVGLALSSIQVALGAAPADTASLSAAVWSDSGGAPESELLPLATLAELSAGPLVTFTAPPAAWLEAGTTYWLVLAYSRTGAEAAPGVSGTASDGEDTAFTGWSVGDTSLHRPPGSGGPWTGAVQTDPQSLRLVVNGTFAGPVPAAAAVAADGTSILLGFDEALHAAMAPNSAFAVTADGAGIAVGGQSADGAELVLRDLSRIIGAGQSVTVSYADPSGEDDPAAVQDADGNDGPSFSIAAANGSAAMPAVPGAPAGLVANSDRASRIQLAWTAPEEAGSGPVSGYRIEVSADGGTTWSDLEPDTGSAATAHSHGGLAYGDTRSYRVSAINAYGTGPASAPASATAGENVLWAATLTVGSDGVALGYASDLYGALSPAQFSTGLTAHAVESLAASGGELAFGLDSALASPGGLALHLDGAAFALGAASQNDGDRHFTWAGGAPDWAVGGTVAVRLTMSAAAPGAPAGLAATPGWSTRIDLAWKAPEETGSGPVSGYRIEVSADAGASWAELVPDSGSAATAHSHSGLSFGDTRRYRVSAINAFGTGPPSAPDSAAADSALRWAATLTVGVSATGTTFGYSSGSDVIVGLYGQLSPAQFSIGGTGHAVDRLHHRSGLADPLLDFTLSAPGLASASGLALHLDSAAFEFDAVSESPNNRQYWWSHPGLGWAAGDTVAVKLTERLSLPGAPAGLTATAMGEDRVDLAWAAPADTGSEPVSGYRIEVSADGGAAWSDLVPDSGGAGTAHSQTGLPAGAARHYRVSAISSVGTGPPSEPAFAVTDISVLWEAVLTVGSDGTGLGYFSGSYGALSPAQFSIGSTARGVQRIVHSQGSLVFGLVAGAEPLPGGLVLHLDAAAFDLDVTTGNTDDIRFAWDSADPGWAVGDTVAVRLTARPAVPGAPAGLTADAMGEHRIDLAWDAPADTGRRALSGYRIEVSADAGDSWDDLEPDTGNTATAYSHTGLLPGAPRRYRVSAINAVGTGPPSGTASATTDSSPVAIVSNAGETHGGTISINRNARAAAFATGSVGVTLSSVQAHLAGAPDTPASLFAALWSDSGGRPESQLLTLSTPSAISGDSLVTFTAPADTFLDANRIYWLVLTYMRSRSEAVPEASFTDSDGEATAFTGWSVGDTTLHRPRDRVGPGTDGWQTAPHSLRIVVNGSFAGPVPATAGVAPDGESILLGFDEALHAAMAPHSAFAVTAHGVDVDVGGQSADGAELVLRDLSRIIGAGQSVTVSYADPSDADDAAAVQDPEGNDGPSFSIAAANGSTAMPAAPGAPAGLVASSDRVSRIQLAWTAPDETGSGPVSGYRIEVSADGGATWSDLEPDTGSAATAHSHSGLAAGATRHYRVSAINAYGTGPASAPASATAGENVLLAATLTVGSEGSALGYFSGSFGALSPSQFSIGITEHAVLGIVLSEGSLIFGLAESSVASPGALALRLDADSFDLGASDTNTENRSFVFGNAGLSWSVGQTVAVRLTMRVAAPGAPADLSATPGGHAAIELAWDAPADIGSSAISGYRIEVSADGGGTWSDRETDTGDTGTAYSHAGLPPAVTRDYRVSAINAAGTGPPSVPASATTHSSPVTLVSNVAETRSGVFSIDGNAYAQSFATGSTGVTLASIQAHLATAPGTPASLSAALWSDSAGAPGSALLPLSTPLRYLRQLAGHLHGPGQRRPRRRHHLLARPLLQPRRQRGRAGARPHRLRRAGHHLHRLVRRRRLPVPPRQQRRRLDERHPDGPAVPPHRRHRLLRRARSRIRRRRR